MSADEFFGKYNGKGVDFDGFYGFQCMDLYRQFCKEVLNVPQSPGVSGAVKVWDTYLKNYFVRIDNTPTGVPIKGDIIIWSQGVGQYGHIAVCKDADINKFTSFDQNWPVGSLCHFQPHNYKYVLGWLRFKPTTTTASPTPPVSTTTIPDNPPVVVDTTPPVEPVPNTPSASTVDVPVVVHPAPVEPSLSFFASLVEWLRKLFKLG